MYETIDPRLIKALALEVEPAFPLGQESSVEKIRNSLAAIEAENNKLGILYLATKPVPSGICHEEVKITGLDNNIIELQVTRPDQLRNEVPSPCVLYIHGGGMGIYSARGAMYSHFAQDIAYTVPATVVTVEFRNSAGALGCHAFPAGLNDCKSALEWIFAQKEARNFSHIILAGESGGANLGCALSLLMKQEDKLHYIDGVYVMCPYISNLYSELETEDSKQLPSLRKFDHCGIVNLKILDGFARSYDPENLHPRNPLAWPYWATVDDLRGMPPHAVSLNEADPLHDEGLAYYRKLLAAGVRTTGRTVLGTPHAGDLIGMNITVDLYKALLYDIKSFVDSL